MRFGAILPKWRASSEISAKCFRLYYGHPQLAGKHLVRVMQRTQFRAKIDLKPTYFLACNFYFETEKILNMKSGQVNTIMSKLEVEAHMTVHTPYRHLMKGCQQWADEADEHRQPTRSACHVPTTNSTSANYPSKRSTWQSMFGQSNPNQSLFAKLIKLQRPRLSRFFQQVSLNVTRLISDACVARVRVNSPSQLPTIVSVVVSRGPI